MTDKVGKAEKADKDLFTERERQIMDKAWLCLNETPTIDFKKLGPMVGMKNHVSASNAWAKIKKKLQAHGGEDGTDNSANGSAAGDDGETPQATPTPRKRGRGKADKADKDDDGESPMKKARGGKGGKKGKKAAEGDDGDEDGEDAAAIKAEAAEEYGELT